jgi:hypothetical protein
MLQMFSQFALVGAIAFQMTAWANAPISRLPSPVAGAAFQGTAPATQLPSAVSAAIKNRFPKAQVLWSKKDFDDGMVKYEVKLRSEGVVYDVDVTPSGKIIKIERDDD